MDDLTVLVFPGLDGSVELLRDFVAASPPGFSVQTLTLPDAESYSTLADKFDNVVRDAGPCILIGESFSGPLAILLAERHPSIIQHLILVASFATSPISSIAMFAPWSLLFRLPLPRSVSRLLIGNHDHLLTTLRTAIGAQSAKTKAKRITMVATVDVVTSLLQIDCPITYLAPTQDRLIHKRHGLSISKTNSRSGIRHIDGPHLILQTCPKKCWDEIKAAIAMRPSQ